MTETIRRVKFTQLDDSMARERQELAAQASKLLGYRPLADALTMPSALLYTLRKLDIEPLVARCVAEYKAKKAGYGMWSGKKFALLWIAIGLGIAFGFVPWLNRGLKWADPSLPTVGVIGGIIAAVVLLVIGLVRFLDSDYRGHRTTRLWQSAPLSEYAGIIPEFVLAKAIRIKTELPEVRFSVESLIESREDHVRPLRDPFLVAMLDQECYYIDVWDERKYENCL